MNARLLGHGIAMMALLLAALWLAAGRLAVPWIVAGRSMEPTLFHGDRLLIDCWTYRHRSPRPGEIVLFEGPEGSPMIKRLVPTPAHAGDSGLDPALWVLGDNPVASRDSRRFGLVQRDRVRGRVVLRFWPLTRRTPIGVIDSRSYNSSAPE